MPLITEKNAVLEVYAEAAERKWVIPTFCSENLTTTEAVLSAVSDYGKKLGIENLPVTLAITNLYDHRSQTLNYTRTETWYIGLKLFLADLKVLCGCGSPFSKLRVMVHLDHIKPEFDSELLEWDMSQFSSIMFDASSKPLGENIKMTGEFVEKEGSKIVVEGACDEIVDAGGKESNALTSPEDAERYFEKTGVDFMVANLGTEHRASAANLKYHGETASKISRVIGSKLVLHGCSSVSKDQILNLFNDGICKVNIWTALERDSSPALLSDMARNAAKVAGLQTAGKLKGQKILGEAADLSSKASLDYFTTVYRDNIIFGEMKKITERFLELWYR